MPYSTKTYTQFNLRIFPVMLESLRARSRETGTPVNTLIQEALETDYANDEYWEQFAEMQREQNARIEAAQAKLEAQRRAAEARAADSVDARRAKAERRAAIADRLARS